MHPIDGEVAKIVARCCVVDISDVRCRFGSPQLLQCRGTTLTRDPDLLWWLSKPLTEHLVHHQTPPDTRTGISMKDFIARSR